VATFGLFPSSRGFLFFSAREFCTKVSKSAVQALQRGLQFLFVPGRSQHALRLEAGVERLLLPERVFASELSPHFAEVQEQQAAFQSLFLCRDGLQLRGRSALSDVLCIAMPLLDIFADDTLLTVRRFSPLSRGTRCW
jgi:hypothetical protein